MALKNCKECGKEVSSKAKTCPHCGFVLKKEVKVSGCFIFIIIFIVFIGYCSIKSSEIFIRATDRQEAKIKENNSPNSSKTEKKPQAKPKLTDKEMQIISELESRGTLILEPEFNKVYIELYNWESMDIKAKERIAMVFAVYCANKKNSDTIWVNIYDKQSGKKIAKYSQVWGFEVY